RFPLHLDRARNLGRARKRAAGNRSMIRALGALEILEGVGVLRLPLEPPDEARQRCRFAVRSALDAERIAGVLALGTRGPAPVALRGMEAIAAGADFDACHRIMVPLTPSTDATASRSRPLPSSRSAPS